MIGADEFTTCDQHWNTIFCGSRAARDRELIRYEQLGFHINGTQVMANRDTVIAALFANDDGPIQVAVGTPEVMHRITPPANAAERARWDAAVTARRAAGRGPFVGDY